MDSADPEPSLDAPRRATPRPASRRVSGVAAATEAGRRRLLAEVSAAAYGRVHQVVVDGLAGSGEQGEWVPVAGLLVEPSLLAPLVDHGMVRFRSDDRGLVIAQVVRETVAALAAAAVDLWVRQRRLLDLTAANVVLGIGEGSFVVGIRRVGLTVLADDPLVGHPEVEVVDEAQLFGRLLARSLGWPLPLGEVPSGAADTIAAVAAIITAVRRLVRCGDRHLWGTVALAAANATTRLSHTVGHRADVDRRNLLTARPDLARTIELVTVPADTDPDDDATPEGTITFALRRTCCLLVKLPARQQCGTCSLRDRDEQLDRLTDWHRQQRVEVGRLGR